MFNITQNGGTLASAANGSKIFLSGMVFVGANLVLTNCQVRMAKNSQLVVLNGVDLKATGTSFSACPDASFMPFTDDDPWLGVQVAAGGWVDLDGCSFDFTSTAIQFDPLFNNANTKILNCDFGEFPGTSSGISVGNNSTTTPLFQPGSFSGNEFHSGTGLSFRNCTNAVVNGFNSFFDCQTAINAVNSRLTVTGTTIQNCGLGLMLNNSGASVNGFNSISSCGTAIKAINTPAQIMINAAVISSCTIGVDVLNCKFVRFVGATTMSGMGTGILGNSSVIVATPGLSVSNCVFGIDLVSGCNLNISGASISHATQVGIRSTASRSVSIRNCPLIDGRLSGIQIIAPPDNVTQLVQNNTFTCDDPEMQTAIQFVRSRTASTTTARNEIVDNKINISGPKFDISGAAISILQTGMSADKFNVHRNQITCSSTLKLMHGIYVSGDGDNLNIQSNRIDFNNATAPSATPLVASLGIGVENVFGKNNRIVNNNIHSTWPVGTAEIPSWIKCAIHLIGSNDFTVCTDTLDHAYRGFHFGGHLHTCDIALNRMSFLGQGMLFDNTNPQIEDQDHHQNIWVPGATFGNGALFEGDPDFRFRHGPGAGLQPPTFSPSYWFVLNMAVPTAENSRCIPGGAPEFAGPEISDFDLGVINSTTSWPSPANEWDQKREVMHKLAWYPQLRPAGSTAAGFWNANLNLSPGLFALAGKHFVEALTPSVFEQSQLDNIDAQLEQKMEEYLLLDPTSSDPQIVAEMETLVAEINTLQSDRLAITEPLEATILANLTNLDSEFAALPTAAVYESTRKTLIAAWLKNAKNQPFSEADYTTFRDATNQCPLTAGTAVREVARWLPIPESFIYTREDYHDQFCLSPTPKLASNGHVQSTAGLATTTFRQPGITVFPNPLIGDDLTISLDVAENAGGFWQILDNTGSIIRDGKVPGGELRFQIFLTGPPSGVYLFRLIDQVGQQHQQKLVIIR